MDLGYASDRGWLHVLCPCDWMKDRDMICEESDGDDWFIRINGYIVDFDPSLSSRLWTEETEDEFLEYIVLKA